MKKAKIAKSILERNAIMIESLLSEEEKKCYKNDDFVSYLIRLCDKELRQIGEKA